MASAYAKPPPAFLLTSPPGSGYVVPDCERHAIHILIEGDPDMAKVKTNFVCQNCGSTGPKWVGRCPECGTWGSVTEQQQAQETPSRMKRRPVALHEEPMPITKITAQRTSRTVTGIGELDRILGGGIVPGSVVLVGGDPGIGKSTILLQACEKVAQKGSKVLYVSAEESAYQTKLRAERLGVKSDNVLLVCETDTDAIAEHIDRTAPEMAVIDSIQMIYRAELPGAPGTVTQVRESAMVLGQLAKKNGVSLFLVGHVTKEGSIAGPKTLEHMVDTVLYFEGDRFQSFRILRAVKNRFGSTNEIGIFEMGREGLAEVTNPSALFLSHDGERSPGWATTAAMIGTRTLLVEVQALTARAVFGMPQRRVSGVDFNRVAMLLAVLERRAGFHIATQDVFVNAVGGVKLDEPAADLAICASIASAFREKQPQEPIVIIGEVGLGGEIRAVSQINQRIAESEKLGFKRAMIPAANSKGLSAPKGIELVKVSRIQDALEMLL
jgi:DNA repair protein RadA/Sms